MSKDETKIIQMFILFFYLFLSYLYVYVYLSITFYTSMFIFKSKMYYFL